MIEDLHDLPFIDASLEPFVVHVNDWSRALSVDIGFNLQASNFNLRNSHWEPIIEPWKFDIKISQDTATKALAFHVKSTELLNVNLTHTFLETLLSVSDTMLQAQVNVDDNSDAIENVKTVNCLLNMLLGFGRNSKASKTVLDPEPNRVFVAFLEHV